MSMTPEELEALLNGPIIPPPEGVTSNFDNPENGNDGVLVGLIFCTVIPAIAFAIRMWERVILPRKLNIEDILTIIAFGCFVGSAYAGFALMDTPGYFTRGWDVRFKDLTETTYWVYIDGLFYALVMPLVKTAMLIEWCRMFVPRGTRTRNYFWWGSIILITISCTAGVVFFILIAARCQPYEANFNPLLVAGCKYTLNPIQTGSSILQIITDIAVFLLPQPVIWRLKLDWQKRAGVSIIFSVGLLACISAAVRLKETLAYLTSDDPIYDLGPLVIWVQAEEACGFFILCIPCLPKLLKEMGLMAGFKRLFGIATTTANSGTPGNYYAKNTAGRGGNLTSNTSKDYYKLDEDGTPLRNLSSESTEQLHAGGKVDNGIMRTTRVTVTEDARSNAESHDMRGKEAWSR